MPLCNAFAASLISLAPHIQVLSGAVRFEGELFSLTLTDFLCYALAMHDLLKPPPSSDYPVIVRQHLLYGEVIFDGTKLPLVEGRFNTTTYCMN